jgi:hypothetical protein
VRADAKGRAWFKINGKGTYEFECGDKKKKVELSGNQKFTSRPGFKDIPVISLDD